MRFSFRMDAMTLCALSGAMLALLLLLDIQSLHRSAPRSAGLTNGVQERVVTKEFILTDGAGNNRVRIGMNELNAPALSLYDKSGTERALLRLNQDDVPSLRLFDVNGTMREGLGFAKGTLEPHLWFFGENSGINQLIPDTGLPHLNYSLNLHDYNTNTHEGVILWDSSTDVKGNGINAR